MNRLFYIIYNSYYKHGAYKNDIPSLTVAGIFSVCFLSVASFIVLLIRIIEDPMGYRGEHISKPITSLITLLFGGIVYFVFYHNKKYKRIYETYKDDVFLNSQMAKYLGFTICLVIIVSPLVLALVRNKVYLGYWV